MEPRPWPSGPVTHEYIGYLWPMGPFYWLSFGPGVPLWVVAATAGSAPSSSPPAPGPLPVQVLDLRARPARWPPWPSCSRRTSCSTPGRISVLLLPWAGLPWMIAFVALALRRGDGAGRRSSPWSWSSVGPVNASSIIYVGVAPALWLVYAVLAEHEATWRTRRGHGAQEWRS